MEAQRQIAQIVLLSHEQQQQQQQQQQQYLRHLQNTSQMASLKRPIPVTIDTNSSQIVPQKKARTVVFKKYELNYLVAEDANKIYITFTFPHYSTVYRKVQKMCS